LVFDRRSPYCFTRTLITAMERKKTWGGGEREEKKE